ncbi:hypothetical protein Pst134EB_001637 [Puccinia striiformis f. sp. tritici]|uniref:Uncharacterized protein n=1 Tax=Puccinia striiformis f. sp. tritici PST-78 TaxID=1165861 RepID=A0A0L0VP16_9BASI|nr:hypothetical protein Pst134EB_001637 [Puccinia striiformis f. sp. tritici]KNF01018.1 hypothetical protein PSTG_05651 [Puccinia striiformis f. sp. tritici PST-78]
MYALGYRQIVRLASCCLLATQVVGVATQVVSVEPSISEAKATWKSRFNALFSASTNPHDVEHDMSRSGASIGAQEMDQFTYKPWHEAVSKKMDRKAIPLFLREPNPYVKPGPDSIESDLNLISEGFDEWVEAVITKSLSESPEETEKFEEQCKILKPILVFLNGGESDSLKYSEENPEQSKIVNSDDLSRSLISLWKSIGSPEINEHEPTLDSDLDIANHFLKQKTFRTMDYIYNYNIMSHEALKKVLSSDDILEITGSNLFVAYSHNDLDFNHYPIEYNFFRRNDQHESKSFFQVLDAKQRRKVMYFYAKSRYTKQKEDHLLRLRSKESKDEDEITEERYLKLKASTDSIFKDNELIDSLEAYLEHAQSHNSQTKNANPYKSKEKLKELFVTLLALWDDKYSPIREDYVDFLSSLCNFIEESYGIDIIIENQPKRKEFMIKYKLVSSYMKYLEELDKFREYLLNHPSDPNVPFSHFFKESTQQKMLALDELTVIENYSDHMQRKISKLKGHNLYSSDLKTQAEQTRLDVQELISRARQSGYSPR